MLILKYLKLINEESLSALSNPEGTLNTSTLAEEGDKSSGAN